GIVRMPVECMVLSSGSVVLDDRAMKCMMNSYVVEGGPQITGLPHLPLYFLWMFLQLERAWAEFITQRGNRCKKLIIKDKLIKLYACKSVGCRWRACCSSSGARIGCVDHSALEVWRRRKQDNSGVGGYMC
ncbi:MAG TPA: hypothetical protein VIF60_16530, partial [Burkholderiaceae bacterium]